jgi:hypothetical protein
MNRYISLVTVLMLCVSACMPGAKDDKAKKSTDWKTVSSDKFTLQLPSHMKEATNLHEDAVLQYQNVIKEFYTIVIEESVEEFHEALIEGDLQKDFPPNLQGYSSLVAEKFSENVDELINKSEFKPLTLNGDSATYFEAEAKISGIEVYYHYAFVRGDSSYYQVMSWTLAGKKDKLHADMTEIVNSFKEK